ncbi:MAG: methyltransferase domain-containing protein [Acidobacteria bacterium]|nr:MAG: methyltransferase domain-containing protein [Acidobacteriota bacterium]
MSAPRLPAALRAHLRSAVVVCPACRGRLEEAQDGLCCRGCGERYGVAGGIPALFPPGSPFRRETEETARGTYFSTLDEPRWQRALRRALPALADDRRAAAIDRRLRRALADKAGDGPLVGLVIGAGERPRDLESRLPQVDWLVSDVDGGYRPQLLADAERLPIADRALDVVVAEMVLEHVMDPRRAGAEIERVLKAGGLALVKTPFCFPWHGIPLDFSRPTPAGLLALFPAFEVLALEAGMGPWGAAAYALDAAFVNLAGRRGLRRVAVVLSRFLFGWMKLLDRLPVAGARRLIGAGSLSFVGRKGARRRTPEEIAGELYRHFGRGP